MKQVFDGIVLGKGIAGLAFLFELAKSQSVLRSKKWAIINHSTLFPACSEATTATVSLSRIDEGISPLGDLLVNSFLYFKENVLSQMDLSSLAAEKVTKKMYFYSENDKQKAIRRFDDFKKINEKFFDNNLIGDCLFREDQDSFLINPDLFQQKMLEYILEKLDVTIICDGIVSVETSHGAHFVKGLNSQYQSSFLVDARGSYQKENSVFFEKHFDQSLVASTGLKTVGGAFLICRPKVQYERSFYIVFDDVNFIYRKMSNELIIGSTSEEGNVYLPNIVELKSKYIKIKENLSEEHKKYFPNFSDFTFKVGLRSKAKRRTPQVCYLDDKKSKIALVGLYKNGYTTSFFLCRQFLDNCHFV